MKSCAGEKVCGIRSLYLTYSSTPRPLPPAVTCTIAVFHLATPSLSWPTATLVSVWVSLTVGEAVQTHHKHLWLIFKEGREGGDVKMKVQVCSCVNDWLHSRWSSPGVVHTPLCLYSYIYGCQAFWIGEFNTGFEIITYCLRFFFSLPSEWCMEYNLLSNGRKTCSSCRCADCCIKITLVIIIFR